MFLKHSRLLVVGALSLGVTSVVSLSAVEVIAAPKKAAGKKPDSEGPRLIAVGPVTGPMQFSVRQWLQGAINNAPDKFAQVDDGKSKELAADADEKAMAGFAKKNKAKAIIVGEVKKTPKGYTLTVKVHGADGVEMDGVEFEGASAAKLKKSVESSLVTALEGVLGMGAAAPQAAAPAAAADGGIAPEAVVLDEDENAGKTKKGKGAGDSAPAEDAAPAPDDAAPKKGSGLTALRVEVGGRARSRSFAYSDPLDGFPGFASLDGVELPAPPDIGGLESGARYPLQDYSLVYPGVFVGLEVYPLAFATDGVGAYFGLVGNYQKDALLTTTAIGDDVLSTASFSYFVGPKVRVPLGKHQVAAFGGIGEHRFDVGTNKNDFVDVITTTGGMSTTANRISEVAVPSTDYHYVRVGLEGTVNVEPIAITAGFAGRLVSRLGELAQDNWFPGAKAQGWDAELRAGLPIVDLGGGSVSLEAGVDYTRYAWTANSIPEDVATARVAGGGVDNYVSGWLGVSFALSGSSGSASVKAVAAGDEATSSTDAAAASSADKSNDAGEAKPASGGSDKSDDEE